MPENCCNCLDRSNKFPSTKCSDCQRCLHYRCTDMSEEEVTLLQHTKSKNIHILCKNCGSSLAQISELRKNLLDMQALFEARLVAIETALSSPTALKSPTTDSTSSEQMIQESVERTIRASNVILVNVPVNPGVDDVTVANEILNLVDPTAVVSSENVMRIGKARANKYPPLLKLKLKSPEMARLVLRKKSALSSTKFSKIFIRDDKTPQQLSHLKELRAELDRRNFSAVKFTIKYVHNVPRTTEIQPGQNLN
ncbi:hypothetical protein Zmor_021877 [Zophobas morio]|uniref:Uncharacterized protein n=1 Tax=Zophobas morio TaxID=2755281 RepID=A0AA38I3B9_9CUCU|nr:hypothetical protein Zmor_021877 [Zophobas morio]